MPLLWISSGYLFNRRHLFRFSWFSTSLCILQACATSLSQSSHRRVNCGCLSTVVPTLNQNSALLSVLVLGMVVSFTAVETSCDKSVQCVHEGTGALELVWLFPILFLLLTHTACAVDTLFTLLLWKMLERLHNFNFHSGKTYFFLLAWLGYIWCLHHAFCN